MKVGAGTWAGAGVWLGKEGAIAIGSLPRSPPPLVLQGGTG